MPQSALDPESIFWAALNLNSPGQRVKYLDEACGVDASLRAEVESLLAEHPKVERFLEQPALTSDTEELIARPLLERPGTVIGPYKLIEQIGEGGVGVVFMAQQSEPVKRMVALKVVKPGMDSRQVIARFETERQALALMDHPNIAKVLDAGTVGEMRSAEFGVRNEEERSAPTPHSAFRMPHSTGRPFFVMELVKGVPITRYCDQQQLSLRERLALFVPVCQAIQHAHQKGIIHRDLKPSNVLIALYDDKPVAKVIDFGVAKATGQQLTEQTLHTGFGAVVGTIEYMSPEQASFNQLDFDTRSDIYSLGVLLYELLTGTTPLEHKRARETGALEALRIVREDEVPTLSARLGSTVELPTIAARRGTEPARLARQVRGELNWIVMKALEKDRSRRYETASGLARDLERFLADEPVQACPPSAWYRIRKFVRRNKAGAVLAAMALVLVLGLGGSIGWTIRSGELRRTKLASQLEVILDEVNLRASEQKWPEALTVARRAETLVAGASGDAALQAQVRQVLADLNLVQRLDEIRLERAGQQPGEKDHTWADQAYATAFREAGIDVNRLPPAEAVAALRSRPQIVVALAAAIDDWARCRKHLTDGAGAIALRTVAQRADPDPWRCRVRDALSRNDIAALEEMSKSPDLWRQPPPTLCALARHLSNSVYLGSNAKPEQATQMLRRAQRQHPADFWINHELAELLETTAARDTQQRIEALGLYRAALALRPQSHGARHGIGRTLNALGRADDVIAWYEKSIELSPQDFRAHFELALSLHRVQRLDEAIVWLRKAVDIEPDNIWARLNLAKFLNEQGKSDESIAVYWKTLEIDPRANTAHVGLFHAIRDQQDRASTLRFFQREVEANPERALAHYNLGNTLWCEGLRAQSLGSFQTACQLDPGASRHHHSLANNYKALKRLDEAIASYRTAIELNRRSAELQYELGDALSRSGRVAEAIDAWHRALEIDADHILAHAALGWKLATAADPQQVVDREPQKPNHWSNLGVALLQAGSAQAAVETLEEADRRWNGDLHHRIFLAIAYWQVGEKQKAHEAFDKATEWIDKKQPENAELRRFRSEAEALLKSAADGTIPGCCR
jgi:serine/threonine protein kinase/tetratricopeptide (TPR) repeat protein